MYFFFNDTATTEIYTLSLHDALPIFHPQLATMLIYLFTDAVANPADLKRLLESACEQTFNCISVDGDTSTNDTRSDEHTSELQSPCNLVCRLLLEKKERHRSDDG